MSSPSLKEEPKKSLETGEQPRNGKVWKFGQWRSSSRSKDRSNSPTTFKDGSPTSPQTPEPFHNEQPRKNSDFVPRVAAPAFHPFRSSGIHHVQPSPSTPSPSFHCVPPPLSQPPLPPTPRPVSGNLLNNLSPYPLGEQLQYPRFHSPFLHHNSTTVQPQGKYVGSTFSPHLNISQLSNPDYPMTGYVQHQIDSQRSPFDHSGLGSRTSNFPIR